MARRLSFIFSIEQILLYLIRFFKHETDLPYRQSFHKRIIMVK